MENKELVVISKKELREIISQEVERIFKPMIINSDYLIGRREVMKILNIDSLSLHKLQRDNAIQFVKINKRVYFKRSEIENFLNLK